MSMTQFTMVEELASLVKDNLSCKHLILSVEEALVDFLQSDTSSNGVLQLKPMNSYNRLLLHRLADIFGFSHESVGEGEERHLVLERCAETSIPSVLVTDILWQYDEPESPMTHLLLRRSESPPGKAFAPAPFVLKLLPEYRVISVIPQGLVLKKKSPPLQHSLEEREAAYLAARERIFSRDQGEVKESVTQRQRNVPVVARRMIAHALGKRINPPQEATHGDSNASRGLSDEVNFQGKVELETNLIVEAFQQTLTPLDQNVNSCGEVKKNNRILSESSPVLSGRMTNQKQAVDSISQNGRKGNGADEEDIKREHLGAAKRMFAHALGRPSRKNVVSSNGRELKQVNME